MSGLMRCLVRHAYVCTSEYVCVRTIYAFCIIAQRLLSVSMSDDIKFSSLQIVTVTFGGCKLNVISIFCSVYSVYVCGWMCEFVLNKIKRICVCVCSGVFGIRMRPSVSMILTLFLNAYVNTHKNTHVASSLAVRHLAEAFCKTFSLWSMKLHFFSILLGFKLNVLSETKTYMDFSNRFLILFQFYFIY